MAEISVTEDVPKSEIEFDARFSNPAACYQYLFQLKWPDGFIYPKCTHKQYWLASRNRYICTNCQHQHFLIAGTIMDGCKKPITYWFKDMWWFTTRKSGINATNLKELLGFGSYGTAWNWLQKLRRCTIRQGREKQSGRVEVDEFYLGGQRSVKRGRGAENKTVVVVAVERDPVEKYIGRIRLHIALDCSSFLIETFILDNIEPGSTIVTDTWSGYQVIDKEQYTHWPVNQSKAGTSDNLYGVRLITTRVRRLIRGTYQGRFEPKYLQNYLDEYVFRFNRRKSGNIGKKFMHIVQQVVSSVKIPWKNIQWDMAPLSKHFLGTGAF